MESYRTVSGVATSRYEDRKSVFYGYATHVTSERDVVEFRHEVMAEVPDASHYVSAYVLHAGGLAHYSDAKEPHGTAGMPVLTVIKHRGLEDVACVVARVFGGTLLGRGGLIRAYTSAAQGALDAAHVVCKAPVRDVLAVMSYSLYEQARNLLEARGVEVLSTDFSADVTMEFRVLAAQADEVCAALTELSAGTIDLMASPERLELVDLAAGAGDGGADS